MTRTRTTTVLYWIATAWLSLGMLSTGAVQLFHLKAGTDFNRSLGYPAYLMPLLGLWKLLGVVVLLLPRLRLLKEWAYAGFFFAMSGAVFSHLAVGDGLGGVAPALLLLALTVLSWTFRPPSRKFLPAVA